jgi:hypothetical protein
MNFSILMRIPCGRFFYCRCPFSVDFRRREKHFQAPEAEPVKKNVFFDHGREMGRGGHFGSNILFNHMAGLLESIALLLYLLMYEITKRNSF